ncbi:class I SAM-dependent methyltransferase [Caloramator sp. mosi_1]|uniref:class I SAM-dependent methyltransferase n=1 Tax=Caloramator sp. mosi_1 TaxID=3023090 RepID=UPI00235F788B|nr:class I SAM-dependent methyltransferase [Caloramator sp. mosi_1]WDC84848.1 class I SAM-dependent methyltransferase [Caloramator sp. mosi_1]
MHKFNPMNAQKLDNPTRRKYMPPYKTLENFGLKRNGKGNFLDIGCGIGYFTIPAAKILTNGKAIGIDISDEMIEIAKDKSFGIENIEYKRCDEYVFPIDSDFADYVMLSNVLHEIQDKSRYINEIRRVLKNGGRVFVIEWRKIDTNYGPPKIIEFHKKML